MTKSAIDLAREALRQRCGGGTEFHSDGAISIAYRFPSRQVADQFQNALAALTTEQSQWRPTPPEEQAQREAMVTDMDAAMSRVPPDRERLVGDLTNFSNGAARKALACQDHDAGQKEWFLGLRDRLRDAVTLLRQPAPAEVPPGIAGLIADIRAKGGFITCPDMLDFLNIVERAMARYQPAPAEIEATANDLEVIAETLDREKHYVFAELMNNHVAKLRRLALPAVGDWRPIEEALAYLRDDDDDRQIKPAVYEEAIRWTKALSEFPVPLIFSHGGDSVVFKWGANLFLTITEGTPAVAHFYRAPPIPEEPSR